MILVDTTIWVDHLRSGDATLTGLLESNQVVMHPMVIGELACGNLRNRQPLLQLWQSLNTLPQASHNEVLYFLEQHLLMGQGIGYIDVHLLAAVTLAGDARLWTRDKRLATVAARLGKHFAPPSA